MSNTGLPRFRKTDCTYVMCPDRACKAFTAPTRENFLCEGKCPKKATLAIVCWHCKKVIPLPNDHFSWCRVDCSCGAMNLSQRMSGMWRRHNGRKRTSKAG